MSTTDNEENTFLFINKDASNLRSRNQSALTKSYVQRSRHLKNWKHRQLRASVSKTYFDWSYRPECISSRRPDSIHESVSTVDTKSSAPRTHAGCPLLPAPGYPHTIDRCAGGLGDARQPRELPSNDAKALELWFTEHSWHSQWYDFDTDVKTKNTRTPSQLDQNLRQFTIYSHDLLAQSSFERNIQELTHGASRELVSGTQDDLCTVHPSQMYSDRSLRQCQQPISGKKSEFRQESTEDQDLGFSHINGHVGGSSNLEAWPPYPYFNHSPDQTTDLLAETISMVSVFPNLNNLQISSGQYDCMSNQQNAQSVASCLQFDDHHCCRWHCMDHWEHCH